MADVAKGLCSTCAYERVIRTTRGSSFTLCERSRSDPRLPKYPRLPVVRCHGYEAGASPTRAAGDDSGRGH